MLNQYHAAAAVACSAMTGLTTHAIADHRPKAQRIDSLPLCPVASTTLHRGWKTVTSRDRIASFRLPKDGQRVPNELNREWWGFEHGDVGYKRWPSDTARDMPHTTFSCAESGPGIRILVSYVHGHWAASLGWHFTAMARLRNGDMLEISGRIDDPYPSDEMWTILNSIRIRDR